MVCFSASNLSSSNFLTGLFNDAHIPSNDWEEWERKLTPPILRHYAGILPDG
jgi:hypothetical protein